MHGFITGHFDPSEVHAPAEATKVATVNGLFLVFEKKKKMRSVREDISWSYKRTLECADVPWWPSVSKWRFKVLCFAFGFVPNKDVASA